MTSYAKKVITMMKNLLIPVFLVCFISCKGQREDMSSVDHSRQTDSIVSAHKNNMEVLKDLLSDFEAVRDDVGKMRAMTEIGRIHRESSDFKTALDYHEKALSLARELKDTANIIYILNQLGTDFRRLGVLDEAAVRHYEALSFCEKYSDRSSSKAKKFKAVSLNGIGNIQLTLQNNDVAENIFRQALEVEISLGSHLGQAINYANIGYIKESGGEMDSAWIYYG